MFPQARINGPAAVLLVATAVTAGCHAGSACNPPGATSGQISSVQNSAAYQHRLAEQSGGVPHVGCRSDATIPIAVQVMRERPDIVPSAARPDQRPTGESHVDSRVNPNPADLSTYQGQIRVLGVGRGIDADDCGKAALRACEGAVDAYFARERMVRSLGIVCSLREGNEMCPL